MLAARLLGPTSYGAFGAVMNLLLVIGVYAAICKAYGLPLRFPGTRAAYDVLNKRGASLIAITAPEGELKIACGVGRKLTSMRASREASRLPVRR